MIWWFRIDELRFAVTVETQVDQSWWLVWHHRQGNWLYRVFEVQPFDASGEWEALYGDIQGIARVEDGRRGNLWSFMGNADTCDTQLDHYETSLVM